MHLQHSCSVLELSSGWFTHQVGFFGQSTNNCWKLIFCAALQPEQAACCSAQQVRLSLCCALVSSSRCLDRSSKIISSLLLASPSPNHSLSFPLGVSAVPQSCEPAWRSCLVHRGTQKCLHAHLWQDQSGISNPCSFEMSRYVIHVTVLTKKGLFPADVNPINSHFVLVSLVIRRCLCLCCSLGSVAGLSCKVLVTSESSEGV